MRLGLKKSFLQGNIEIISSKSIGHRALLLASMCNEESVIFINKLSKDIEKTLEILTLFGALIERGDGFIKIRKGKALYPEKVDFGESGASYRFLLPISFIEGRDIFFSGSERLAQRPIYDLIGELEKQGIVFSAKELPFRARGKYSSDERIFSLPGNVSSQYISSVLMLGACLDGKTTIYVCEPLESKPYIDMTLGLLEMFGVDFKSFSGGYVVDGGLKSPGIIRVEPDYSNAFSLIAMGILNGNIRLENMPYHSLQGDRKIIDALLKVGADIRFCGDALIVKKSSIGSVDIDMSDMPDLIPSLLVLLSQAEGKSVIRNVERLRYKESDRIESSLAMAENIGIKAYYDAGNIYVDPSEISGGRVNSFNDHRIVMAASLAALASRDKIEIDGVEAVEKSYPGFFEDILSLGMNIEGGSLYGIE